MLKFIFKFKLIKKLQTKNKVQISQTIPHSKFYQ